MNQSTNETLDLSVVQELVSLAATIEGSFLRDTLGQFKGRCDNVLTIIDEGITHKDEKKVANAAHSLAGSAAILGASALRSCLIEMEDEARTGQWKGITQKRAILDSLCATSVKELQRAFE